MSQHVLTEDDWAAIRAAYVLGDLAAEVKLSGGRTVMLCYDEAADLIGRSGDTGALGRYLAELVRVGRGADVVTVEDPKDRQVPVQLATVGEFVDALREARVACQIRWEGYQ